MEYVSAFLEWLQSQLPLFAALVGVGLFIPKVVDLAKLFGLVPDGQSAVYARVLEAVFFVVFAVQQRFVPDVDVYTIDAIIGQVAAVIGAVITLLLQMGFTQKVYGWWKNTGLYVSLTERAAG